MSAWGDSKMFEVGICNDCHVEFGVPFGFTASRRSDKRSFTCPNGHSMSFTESLIDVVRRERDRLKQQLAQKDDEIVAAKKQASVAEGLVTRMKNRAAAGLCSCCNRHFTNLQRHMASKHKMNAAREEALKA